jgi:hypothetical protein
MAIRIPSNQVVESKYTQGGEYILLSTHREYQGYYYELNNKLFAGKEFNINAPEIIKLTSDKVNKLLLNPSTKDYGKLSNIKIQSTQIRSIPNAPTNEEYDAGFKIRYFIKKVNETSFINIKEVNKDTFDNLQFNPLYQTLKVKYDLSATEEQTNDLDKKMPGLKAFLQDEYFPTSSDESDNKNF